MGPPIGAISSEQVCQRCTGKNVGSMTSSQDEFPSWATRATHYLGEERRASRQKADGQTELDPMPRVRTPRLCRREAERTHKCFRYPHSVFVSLNQAYTALCTSARSASRRGRLIGLALLETIYLKDREHCEY